MGRDFQLGDYNDVPSRIAEAREKWPDGRLRPVNPEQAYRVETIGNATFIVYTAAFYRTADDPLPGIGVAWEPFPGKTNYTRDSELQNAETSAWGRAIVAALQADAKKGIASAEEVRNRHADREAEWEQAAKAPSVEQVDAFNTFAHSLNLAADDREIHRIGRQVKAAEKSGELTHFQYEQLARKASERLAELQQSGPVEPDGSAK
ncbi:MAG TPA: hypothetical protein VFR23_04645 [Jiangellaceae bacterium]|nr:hypothetical protein [Jiangellaceae bacterium]